MTHRLTIAFAAVVIAAVSLAACGGDDSTTTDTGAAATSTTESTTGAQGGGGGAGGAGGTVAIAADPTALAYTSGDLSVDSGTVIIDFENPASLGHDVRIEDSSETDVGGTSVISSSSESAEVDLQPGTYTYYCSVAGHRGAGMEATLTVK